MSAAVTYAETTLGVHEILEATIEAKKELDSIYTVLAEKRDAKRLAEQNLSDREMELAITERGKHADMSATAMEKHLKQVLFVDAAWKELRDEIRELNNDLDGADLDRKIKEREVEIGCARMNELGGYLNYLASVKNAATAAKQSQ